MTTGRVLGLDIGSKRIGVAVSDETGFLATAVATVQRGKGDRAEFRALIERWQPSRLVSGLPTGMSGREGPQAADTRVYAEQLARDFKIELDYYDERLSSVMAERAMIDSGMSKSRRKENIDAVAAAIMLQGYLDNQRIRRR